MKCLHHQAGSGRSKGMAQRNTSAMDVELGAIDLADRSVESEFFLGPLARFDRLDGGKDLSRKSLMHSNQIDVLPAYARVAERVGDRISRSNEQGFLFDIDGGRGVSPDCSQNRNAQLTRLRFTHEEYRAGAIRQRRSIA